VTRRALLLAALALCGCGAIHGVRSRLPPREPQPGPEAGQWADLRDAATRQQKLYDGFIHRATATATWLSPEVREAATRRLAEWQGWSQADLDTALAADRAEAAKGEEFVLAFYTAERRQNDLDARPSIWRLELLDGTDQAAAASATVVSDDATMKQLFPYVGPFDLLYRVRVPWKGAPLAGRPFQLRIAGAVGRMELRFNQKAGEAERPHQAP
jgi:hypothetical protein